MKLYPVKANVLIKRKKITGGIERSLAIKYWLKERKQRWNRTVMKMKGNELTFYRNELDRTNEWFSETIFNHRCVPARILNSHTDQCETRLK